MKGIKIGQYNANLTKHKNGASWYCTYSFYDYNGKRIQKQVSLNIPINQNKKKAFNAMIQYLTELNEKSGNVIDLDSTISQVASKWLSIQMTSVRANTLDRYKLNVKKIESYCGNLKIVELSPAIVKEFIAYLRLKGKKNQKTGELEPMAASSVRDVKMCLSMICTYAIDNQIINRNPCDTIKVKNQKNNINDIKYLDFKAAKEFINFIPDDHELKNIITAAINFGLRRSELLGLRFGDIDFAEHTLTVRSTITRTASEHAENDVKSISSNRIIPLSQDEIDFFLKIKKKKKEIKKFMGGEYHESDYVFTRDDGNLFRPDSLYKRSKKLLEKFGEPELNFHSFRHTYASILHEKGVDLLTAQRLLGHSDPTITLKIYTHNNRQAIEANPIGLIKGGQTGENIRKNIIYKDD